MDEDLQRTRGPAPSRWNRFERAAYRIKRWSYHVIWRIRIQMPYRWREFRRRLQLVRSMGLIRSLLIWRAFRLEYACLREKFGERARRGRLDAFAETGTEGFCWQVYEAGKSGYEGMVLLDKGDWLIVYRHDGTVAFNGVIDPDPKAGYMPYPMNPQYGQPCAFGCWIHWTQRGWNVEDWAALFFHGVIVSDVHELLRGDRDAVPFRAIVVKSEVSQSYEDDEDDSDTETPQA